MKNIAFIDAANIILSSQRAGMDIDFLKLKTYLVDKFKVENIYYFTANLKSIHEELRVLEMNNFSLVLKQVYFEKSKTKANCDVEISHYITKMVESGELSKLILLSGDGDFSILLDYANKNDIDTVLMSTDVKTTSKILRVKKYLKIIFLEQIITKITKEKTPAST